MLTCFPKRREESCDSSGEKGRTKETLPRYLAESLTKETLRPETAVLRDF